MFMQGDGFGVVSQLRTCLASAFYGQEIDPGNGKPVARVDSASEPDEFLDGQSKLQIPYLMCVLGDDNPSSQSQTGATVLTENVERLEVYIVLDAKPDRIGRKATDQIHQVKLDVWKCLHGWNPFLAAKCQDPPVEYGYCAKMFIYAGFSFFEQDPERVVWVMDFDLHSTITSQAQGFGPSNPVATEPLTHIHADFNPVDTAPVDHSFPVVHVHP